MELVPRRQPIFERHAYPVTKKSSSWPAKTRYRLLSRVLVQFRGSLTLSEFGIIKYISSRTGTDITYQQIYDLIHGHGFASGDDPDGFRANVRTFIKRIRRKFQNIDGTFQSIENYPEFDYRWHQ